MNLVLQKAEQGYISENSVGEDVLSRMKSTSHWRAGLVVSCLNLFFFLLLGVACVYFFRRHFYVLSECQEYLCEGDLNCCWLAAF